MITDSKSKISSIYLVIDASGNRLTIGASYPEGVFIYDKSIQQYYSGSGFLIYFPRNGLKIMSEIGFKETHIPFQFHFSREGLSESEIQVRLQNMAEYFLSKRQYFLEKFSSNPADPSSGTALNPVDFVALFNNRCFYHFTDTRNLSSITEHGLCSLLEIKKRGISVIAPGGNDISHKEDLRRGLASYVHLCFFDEHPMEHTAKVKEKRLNETVFLQVSRDILLMNGVRFTAEVANRADSRLLTPSEAFKILDLKVICDWTDWKDPNIKSRLERAKRYEILVPTEIPANLITIPNHG